MSFFKKFAASSKELGNVRALAVCAMMLALRVVLGMFANLSLNFFPIPVVKINPTFIPIAITAYLFGPVCSGIVAGVGDILSYLIQPTAFGFTPGITACCILEGVIYGVFLYKTDLNLKSIILAKVFDLLLCTLTLNSFVLWFLYFQTTPIYMVMLYRAAVLVPFAVIEVLVIRALKHPLEKVNKLKT